MHNFMDLAEHTGTLVALISMLSVVCGTIVYWVASSFKRDLLEMVSKLDKRIEGVWEEISKIRENQLNLRAALPKEYMRLEGPGYHLIIEGITRIETHFEQFAQDCRDGKCGGKKG